MAARTKEWLVMTLLPRQLVDGCAGFHSSCDHWVDLDSEDPNSTQPSFRVIN